MKKFDLLLCSLSYLPSYGGLVSYMKGLAGHIVAGGGNVTVLTTDSKNYNLKRAEVVEGVLIRRIDAFNFSRCMTPITPYIVIKKIEKQIADDYEYAMQSDLIVVRHVYYACALLKFPSLIKKSVFIIPLVSPKLQLLNAKGEHFLRRCYSYLVAIQLYMLERRVVRKFGNIATLSKSKSDEVRNFYKIDGNILVLNPGVDTVRFSPIYDDFARISIINLLQVSEDQGLKIVLTVCRLVEEKQVGSLITAMGLLGREFILYVVGDGPQRTKLESMASALGVNVRFWGRRNDVELFYRIADVFVLASTYEGFGHVYLEAMASGCPVIGVKSNPPYSITATEEIVEHLKNGAIASSGKPSDLANAIKSVIAKPEMKEFSRSFVEKKYSWRAHIEQLVASFS